MKPSTLASTLRDTQVIGVLGAGTNSYFDAAPVKLTHETPGKAFTSATVAKGWNSCSSLTIHFHQDFLEHSNPFAKDCYQRFWHNHSISMLKQPFTMDNYYSTRCIHGLILGPIHSSLSLPPTHWWRSSPFQTLHVPSVGKPSTLYSINPHYTSKP